MKRSYLFLALAFVAGAASAATTPAPAAAAQPDHIALPTNVVPSHYALTITPNAAKASFTGSVKIDIDVKQDTPTIELNAADLKFKKVAIEGLKGSPKVAYDKDQQTATLTFKKPVTAGHHVLDIDYTGVIYNQASGLFYLDYTGNDGAPKRALFTQFENSDARRFLPSWDEPGIKATFSLSAIVPGTEMPLSNTRIAKTTDLKHNLVQVDFEQTPKMSSYLLFFGLGEFERIHQDVNGVDVGVVMKRGDAAKGQYALDAAAHILPYYENYFGVKYPLAKLDLIAGPGQSQFFGAMENWGAIFYFERALLVDPKISTQLDQIGVYVVVAHEMAHQWFGDLVTMAWWDNLWLNEGFASWMQIKSSDHFNPQWDLWLATSRFKEEAMDVDSREGTHPIVTPIHDVLQANQAFDTITYSKGMAVIRMLETYVGADAFQAGVQAYMKAHAYGNTVSDDLWAELDKTSKSSITQVAHDFTLQAGVPLIRETATPTGIHLTQDRFAFDSSGSQPTSWHVPVTVATVGGEGTAWHGLVSREKPADVTLAAGSVPVINAGQSGYYRVAYDAPTFKLLAADFQKLKPADQLGLLNDSGALGAAGYAPLSNYLQLTSKLTPDMNVAVLSTSVEALQHVNHLYEGLPGQAAFQAYARKLIKPLYVKLGWTPLPNESQITALLRTDVLRTLSEMDDPDVIAAAQQRLAAFIRNPSALVGDERDNTITIAAYHADSDIWEQLHQYAKSAKNNLEQRELYFLLGTVEDPVLAQKALDVALTNEAPETSRPAIISAVSISHPDMAVDFVAAHDAAIQGMLEPTSQTRFMPRLASNGLDISMVAKLDAYADKHIPANARGDVLKAEGTIKENAMIRTKRLPDVDAWLAAQPK